MISSDLVLTINLFYFDFIFSINLSKLSKFKLSIYNERWIKFSNSITRINEIFEAPLRIRLNIKRWTCDVQKMIELSSCKVKQ